MWSFFVFRWGLLVVGQQWENGLTTILARLSSPHVDAFQIFSQARIPQQSGVAKATDHLGCHLRQWLGSLSRVEPSRWAPIVCPAALLGRSPSVGQLSECRGSTKNLAE